MNIQVPYGKEKISISVDDSRVIGVYTSNLVEIKNEAKIVSAALEQPYGGKDFGTFLAEAKDVLVIVNDGTRPTPTAKVLANIHEQLKTKDVSFMVATGAHRGPTDDEWKMILGDVYDFYKDHLLVHDAKKSETVFLGTSKNGTQMHLNRRAMEADSIIVIGSVEPHYFAGYTGGRKGFLPGVASYETIQQNHKFALRPEAKALALEGNPVHEDMVDAMSVLEGKKIFSIQTVLDSQHRIYGMTSGDINESFFAAIDMANEVFCIDIPEKADVVVASAPYPMDIDLYQSQKALDNGWLALKEGGILILVAQCRDGIGGKTFYELLSGCETPKAVLETIEKGYKLGYHKAAKIAGLASYGEIWGITKLDPEVTKQVFITPQTDLQEAIDKALSQKGQDSRVIFLTEASITVPNPRN